VYLLVKESYNPYQVHESREYVCVNWHLFNFLLYTASINIMKIFEELQGIWDEIS